MLQLGASIMFFVLGLVLFQFPPKKPNLFYGYKTPRACKNQQNWDFSQKYSGIKLAQGGGVLIFISILLMVLDIDHTPVGGLGYSGCLLVSVIYPIYATEKALKHFEKLNEERKKLSLFLQLLF